jgi:exonuclease SbcC
MKIIKLRFKAFGPFLKEQCIDFTELNAKGIFLINGPTGTGKTTIFDAVVFALYGKGSGKDRDDGKSLRSDFAKDDDITYTPCDLVTAPSFLRMAERPGAKGGTVFYYHLRKQHKWELSLSPAGMSASERRFKEQTP